MKYWSADPISGAWVEAPEFMNDAKRGELKDLLVLTNQLREQSPDLTLDLVGFSFGAYMQACVARHLADEGRAARACLAGMPYGEVEGGRRYEPRRAPSRVGPWGAGCVSPAGIGL